jgi:tetratricopeptide (TPR) repeat protein
MLMGTIDGQIAFAKGDGDRGVEAYKKALSYNTVLDRDSRSSFLRYVNSMPLNTDKKKIMEILDYAISLAEKNVKYNPSDNLMELQFAQVLDSAARVSATTGEKFYYYSNWSLEVIEKAIQSSPGRIPVYFIKAQIYLTRGEADNAIETLKYAISLNKDYYESSCQLAKVYIILGKEEEGYPLMNKCIDKGGKSILTPASFVKLLINHYLDKEDIKRLVSLHEILVEIEPNDAMTWVNLSKLYLQVGEKQKAIEAAEKSAQLDKSLESSVEKFIESLK